LRISRKKPWLRQSQLKRHRINNFIHCEQVRLIDENGQNLGTLNTADALALARDKGLDLVEVSPLANPPVVKIVDYSKLKYQEEKERRKEKAKQKKIEVKGIRLSLRISGHDKEIRVKRAEDFLNGGDKVKVELLLSGRERQHFDLAREIVNKFVADVNVLVPVNIEQSLTIQGGKLSLIIAKK